MQLFITAAIWLSLISECILFYKLLSTITTVAFKNLFSKANPRYIRVKHFVIVLPILIFDDMNYDYAVSF